MLHLGDSSNDLWHSVFNGSWSPNVKLANEQSKAAPALAGFSSRIHVVHLGDSSNQLWHSLIDQGARESAGIVMHEMMHCIGFYHEQSREDRDSFVVINFSNIRADQKHNFNKENADADDSGLYDYLSIMHYGPRSFAIDGTIDTIRQGSATSGFLGTFANVGQRAGLSAGDMASLRAYYPPWSFNFSRISGQKSKAAVALADLNGRLHMVHLGDTSNDIWHSVFNGSAWSPNVKVPNQKSKASPALATLNGQVHMVHLGDSSNDIWHSIFDGTSWSTNVKIPNQKSKSSPALAVVGGQLHMVHLGDSSNDIWHSVFNGSSWSANVKVPNQKSKASPALAALNGELHMVHLGDSASDIWHSIFNGSSWSANVTIHNQRSKAAPSLAAHNGQLHIVHLGESSNNLWYGENDGTWRPNVLVQSASSIVAPALASSGGRMRMVYASGSRDLVESIYSG
jgi:hypothetical protein